MNRTNPNRQIQKWKHEAKLKDQAQRKMLADFLKMPFRKRWAIAWRILRGLKRR